MRVVMSVPWSSPWLGSNAMRGADGIEVLARAKDWNPTRADRVRQTIGNAWRLWRATKHADAVIVCTATLDAIGAAIAMRFRRRAVLAVWDFQSPSSRALRRVGRLAMRRVDVWTVLRRSDAALHERDLGARSVQFVPFGAFGDELSTRDDGYVYAAGTASRDWPTLVEAVRTVDAQVRISTPDAVDLPPELADRVRVLALVNPAEGQQMCANATLVCIPFVDATRPAGPSVVVDAMALGKAVVATNVGGTRDYIVDGVNGRLIPPGDVSAMTTVLRELLASADERQRLGAAAQIYARSELAPTTVLAQLLDLVAGGRRR